MHYDPNYKNQFFHQSSNVGMNEALDILRREISSAPYKTKMPKKGLSKVVLYALPAVSALVLIITAIVWLITKSFLFTLVLFVILAFCGVGIMALISVIAGSILRKKCSEAVEATCIGYSYAAGSNGGSPGARIDRTPVFEYEYHGYKCVAFDGVYDNFSRGPLVSQQTTILVNPEDPEDIVWNFGKTRQIFLILAFLFASVLSIAMLFVVLGDENFMNSALSEGEPQAETGSVQNSESEIPSEAEAFVIAKSDDGRIIMNDAYLRNEVFTAYPGCEYVIKKRKVSELEVLDDGEIYVLRFEPDPDFSESEWYYTPNDITEEAKNAKPGDAFIFAEVKGNGAAWIFSTKEYVLEDE